ncbi:MAG: 4'-phosphopantetheinyl transferase superfamily protein [Planctomycetota bacterium]|nr:4'-phosphopantetheinyl transferase superfamily protein [Planctomycetota bacterium]
MSADDTPIDKLLSGLLPPTVRLAWQRLDDAVEPEFRFAEEAAHVEGAVAKRRVEFGAGRALFHRLHDELLAEDAPGSAAGPALAPAAPLLVAEDRGPLWPAGVVGSISHTKGLCVVALARTSDHPRLGLDVEVTAPLPDKLWPSILTVSERARIQGLGARGPLLSKLHFSGKEAVYKWLSRDEKRVVAFEEVELGFSLARGSFATSLLFENTLPRPTGSWRIGREFLATAVW